MPTHTFLETCVYIHTYIHTYIYIYIYKKHTAPFGRRSFFSTLRSFDMLAASMPLAGTRGHTDTQDTRDTHETLRNETQHICPAHLRLRGSFAPSFAHMSRTTRTRKTISRSWLSRTLTPPTSDIHPYIHPYIHTYKTTLWVIRRLGEIEGNSIGGYRTIV